MILNQMNGKKMNRMKEYVNIEYNYDKITMAAVCSLLWAIGGICGFIYEVIFYYFNGGMNYVYWRGGCFGPWITIYGIGSILIYFMTYRFRYKPLLIFIFGGIVSGTFELLSGMFLYYAFHGYRGWDYNTERWNFGNIGGFICFRSILVFALSSVFLIYIVVPVIFYFEREMNRKVFLILAFAIGGLFVLDVVYNFFVAPRIPSFIDANTYYKSLGWHTLNYY